MAQWTNNDGLIIRLGTTEAEVTRGGEVLSYGPDRTWEFVIDLANLGSASALLEDTQDVLLPAGLNITEIEIIAEVAGTSGGSATLNLGLIRQDQSTTYSAAGLVSALALTSFDAIGETTVIRVGSTGAGALVGTTLANTGYLVADYDTAAFTAGRLRVRIKGYVKRPSASN